MKRVIDGKTYDTSTSKEIGSVVYPNSYPSELHVSLYTNQSGYFLSAENSSGFRHIKVLSRKQGLAWAEEHLCVSEK